MSPQQKYQPTVPARQDKLAQLRAKLKTTDMGGGGVGFWSPKEGKNIIRIMPETGDMDFFFQTVGVHHLPNKKRVYCPRFTTEDQLPCPICETVDQLYRGDAAQKQLAGELRVRKAYWMNVIVRGEENLGPQIYTPGVTVFGSIASLISDPDYGDVMDIDDGIDITIDRSGKGLDTEYQVTPRRNSSPLSEDADLAQEWLDKAKDLSYVLVDDDPEHDKELSAGHAIFLLPYDRIAAEFDLDAVLEEPGEEPVEDTHSRNIAKAKPVTKPVSRQVIHRSHVVEEEQPTEDSTEGSTEEPEESPVRSDLHNRQARRSLRR